MRQTDGHIGEGLQSGNDLRTLRSRRLLPCLYGALPPILTLQDAIINQRIYFAFGLHRMNTQGVGRMRWIIIGVTVHKFSCGLIIIIIIIIIVIRDVSK